MIKEIKLNFAENKNICKGTSLRETELQGILLKRGFVQTVANEGVNENSADEDKVWNT